MDVRKWEHLLLAGMQTGVPTLGISVESPHKGKTRSTTQSSPTTSGHVPYRLSIPQHRCLKM